MSSDLLSIITPTYNRADLLWDCFKSLQEQTSKSFEWIVVDDGSTDHTKKVMKDIISLGLMRIQYVYKKNGGKHTALNAAHPYINGTYVLVLDSDDVLISNAVEVVLSEWNKYKNNNRIGTIIFLKGDKDRNKRAYALHERVPEDYRSAKRISVTSSDFCEVFRANLFKRFPYSEFKNEKFLSESELWNKLAEKGYLVLYINDVIYTGEYLYDGLTTSGRRMRIRNPLGGMCTSKYFFNKKYSLQVRIKKCLLYVCYGFFANFNSFQILTFDKEYYLLKSLCLIPGYLMYRMWKIKYW